MAIESPESYGAFPPFFAGAQGGFAGGVQEEDMGVMSANVPAAFRTRAFQRPSHLAASVEAFIAECNFDASAVAALRSAPPNVQRAAVQHGSLHKAKNPSSALMARLRMLRESFQPDAAAKRPQPGVAWPWAEEDPMQKRPRLAPAPWGQDSWEEAAAEASEGAFAQWGEEALQSELSLEEFLGQDFVWQDPAGSQPQEPAQPQWWQGATTAASSSGSKPQSKQRSRVSDDLILGEVVEWRGHFGWLRPVQEIEHEKAGMHQGRIFLHEDDVLFGGPLRSGQPAEFYLYEDRSGLGAEGCVAAAALSGDEGGPEASSGLQDPGYSRSLDGAGEAVGEARGDEEDGTEEGLSLAAAAETEGGEADHGDADGLAAAGGEVQEEGIEVGVQEAEEEADAVVAPEPAVVLGGEEAQDRRD